MIDSVGYTDDGNVWMNILFRYENDPIKMVVTMTHVQAQEVSKCLEEAAIEAKKNNERLRGSNGNQ